MDAHRVIGRPGRRLRIAAEFVARMGWTYAGWLFGWRNCGHLFGAESAPRRADVTRGQPGAQWRFACRTVCSPRQWRAEWICKPPPLPRAPVAPRDCRELESFRPQGRAQESFVCRAPFNPLCATNKWSASGPGGPVAPLHLAARSVGKAWHFGRLSRREGDGGRPVGGHLLRNLRDWAARRAENCYRSSELRQLVGADRRKGKLARMNWPAFRRRGKEDGTGRAAVRTGGRLGGHSSAKLFCPIGAIDGQSELVSAPSERAD